MDVKEALGKLKCRRKIAFDVMTKLGETKLSKHIADVEDEEAGRIYNIAIEELLMYGLAAEALERHIPKEPKQKETIVNTSERHYLTRYICPRCDEEICKGDYFCKKCGQALNWEEQPKD